MRSLWNFLKYNNAVSIGLFVIFGMGTAAFAATPAAQQAVYNSQDKVVSVDNTYIVNADIPHFDFHLQITGISEDADVYYVSFSYNTISTDDYVWKPVAKTDVLKFSKKEIEGHDLGLAVSKQLSNLIDSQIAYLTAVQVHEKTSGQTQKVVSTEYSGLVGKFLDPTQKVFPGYVPVIAEATSSEVHNDQLAALGLANADAANVAAAARNAVTPDAPPSPLSRDQINHLIEEKVNEILVQQASDAAAAAAAAANTPLPTPVETPAPVLPPPVVISPVTPPVVVTPPPVTPSATTTPPVDTPPDATTTPPAIPPDTTPPAAPDTPPDASSTQSTSTPSS